MPSHRLPSSASAKSQRATPSSPDWSSFGALAGVMLLMLVVIGSFGWHGYRTLSERLAEVEAGQSMAISKATMDDALTAQKLSLQSEIHDARRKSSADDRELRAVVDDLANIIEQIAEMSEPVIRVKLDAPEVKELEQ